MTAAHVGGMVEGEEERRWAMIALHKWFVVFQVDRGGPAEKGRAAETHAPGPRQN